MRGRIGVKYKKVQLHTIDGSARFDEGWHFANEPGKRITKTPFSRDRCDRISARRRIKQQEGIKN